MKPDETFSFTKLENDLKEIKDRENTTMCAMADYLTSVIGTLPPIYDDDYQDCELVSVFWDSDRRRLRFKTQYVD